MVISMSLNVDEIIAIMNEANIHGVSVAILAEDNVTPVALGTSECGLYRAGAPPLEDTLSQFDGSRYFLTPKGMYYFDKSTNQLEDLKIDEEQHRKLTDCFSKDKTYIQYKGIPCLPQEKLNEITAITNHAHHAVKIETNTPFRAASLSKPLFSYLVLKLIEEHNTIKKKLGLSNFNLDTPLYEILPGFDVCGEQAKKITVGMVLSHQTGVSNSSQENGEAEVLFEPGSEFGYAGFPFLYLQMALEKQTGRTLQSLAQEYVFTPCQMVNSDFLIPGSFFNLHEFAKKTGLSHVTILSWTHEGLLEPFKNAHSEEPLYSVEMVEQAKLIQELKKDHRIKPDVMKDRLKTTNAPLFPIDTSKFSSISANSLRTTATDYANFMKTWMNDKKLSNYLISPVISMTKDNWAKQVGVSDALLQNISWGYGVGLQHDTVKVNAVFHYGDMSQWRSIVVMNPNDETGVVLFANSPDGIILSEEITKDNIDAKQALEFIRDKFSFAVAAEEGWEAKQAMRDKAISLYLDSTRIDAAKQHLEHAKQDLGRIENTLECLEQPTSVMPENTKAWIHYNQQRSALVDAVIHARKNLKKAENRLSRVEGMSACVQSAEHEKADNQTMKAGDQALSDEVESKAKCQEFKDSIQQIKEGLAANKNESGIAQEPRLNDASPSPFDISKGPKTNN